MGLFNIDFPTLGGEIWWDTILSRNGWKLQVNKVTDHARILDPYNIRKAWGSEYEMRKEFDNLASVTQKNINIDLPVINAHIFWETQKECEGWELQVNTITEHARIIDSRDIRRAWGAKSDMEKCFDYIFCSPGHKSYEELVKRVEEVARTCTNVHSISDL